MIVESSAFPIEEDELLSVSEKLVYLGRQKDVAEVRRWLRQFDDDARIEVAFLLLKRLVEDGFVNDGAFVNGLAKMEESVKARRQDVGDGAWRIARTTCTWPMWTRRRRAVPRRRANWRSG